MKQSEVDKIWLVLKGDVVPTQVVEFNTIGIQRFYLN